MEARHAGRAGQAAAERTGPERTEPRDTGEPVDMATAIENVTAVIDVDWARQFDQHRRDDGSTFYVDTATGEQFDTLPPMASQDGRSV